MNSLSNITQFSYQPTELVDALNTLGVIFLRGGDGVPVTIAPDTFIAALAASPEARLRMALIPLLLTHPEFAADVDEALQSLSLDAGIVLRCYYTAAYWLQAKYRARLVSVCGLKAQLPNLFSAELNMAGYTEPDAALRALAVRQQEMTGRVLNWHGTYGHAAQSWLRFMEHKNRWQQSHPIKFTHS